MRVVLVAGGDEVDVEVAVHDPAATVADLAEALARSRLAPGSLPSSGPVLIDGMPAPAETPLSASGLRPGCALALAAADAGPRCPPAPGRSAELLVVGGVAAGGRHDLPLGPSTVGRDPGGAVRLPARTTSSRHARFDVEAPDVVSLADAGSTSGTWVDGQSVTAARRLDRGAVAALGATLVRVGPPVWREPAVLGSAAGDGRRPLHRPPPPAPLAAPPPLTPPSADPPRLDTPRFGWAAALVPLMAGLVLAKLVDPRLALFTLLGPAVLVGQWVEDRRRHRRRGADASATRRVDLAAFADHVHVACATEGRRRHDLHPDPATVGREIEVVGAGLWSRRPGSAVFAEVTVGMAPSLTWSPATTVPADGPAAVVLAAARLPPGCPATAALAAGHHLGIAGPRSTSLAVARWVVLQLAAHHGPADLRVAVVCAGERAGEWGWAAFLPHTSPGPAAARPLLGAGRSDIGEVVDQLVRSGPDAHVVVVVDGEGLAAGWGRTLLARVSTVTLGPSRRALPGRCTSVLELDGPDGWGRLTSGQRSAQAVLATGIDACTARSWARRLAPLSDPELAGGGASTPAAARLLDLLGLDRPTPLEVSRRWAGQHGASTPLGCTGAADGAQAVHLDLVADGPHMLVAGTTGAGKSELLRSLVAGLAASSPPDRLALLLVDYKGGAAFAEAAGLPHVVGVVTDLGPDEAARALHSLEAELRRREAVLARLGVRDLVDHPAHRTGPAAADVEALPRLVVVVDELAALVAELPSFLDGLVQLAARGRSLGLHLVLATQRPGSVVGAAVRTNCTIRCCLRVPDEADAVDVVGSPAPAHLDRRLPGRAFLRRGAGDLVEVQVALVGGCRPADRAPVLVEPATFGPGSDPPQHGDGGEATDLALLVGACRAAAAGIPAPQPLWLPPLPADLAAQDLQGREEDVVLGLLDDPGHQRRLPLAWRPEEGPLVAFGSGPGPALALQAVARSLAAVHDPGRLHVYGLDLAGQGLATLTELPHVGALLRPGEHERLHRLLRRLADELAARQAIAAPVGDRARTAPPLVLVLVDGVAALRSSLDGAVGTAALDALERVVVDGPGLGLVTAVTADRLAAVPPAWGAAASCRLAFRGGDPLELLSLGSSRVDQTGWPDGRCLDLSSNLVAQLATTGWPDPAPRGIRSGPGPRPVAVLGRQVLLHDVLADRPPSAGGDGLYLPVGIDGRALDVAVARLRPAQPFVICGPPGSGRSTALATLAASATRAGCEVVGVEGLAALLPVPGAWRDRVVPLVVAVDDADRTTDPDGSLAELAAGRHPGAHLVAVVPLDALRSAFGHWSTELRRAGAGLVLRPRSELDADVLGVPLLPRWTVPLAAPGRGVLVSGGDPSPVQVAQVAVT